MLNYDFCSFLFICRNCDSFYIVHNICILGVLYISNDCTQYFVYDSRRLRKLIYPTLNICNIHKDFSPTRYIQTARVQKLFEWIRFIFVKYQKLVRYNYGSKPDSLYPRTPLVYVWDMYK
jgi:hypothetical protein